MKIAAVNEVRAKFTEYLKASQEGRVVITSHGKPIAMIVGVEGQALDSLVRQSDEAEAKILAARRKEPTVPWEQVKAELGLAPAKKTKPTPRRKRA